MTANIIDQISNENPLNKIQDKELDVLILKLGSFLSILNNKKVNQAKLLVTIVKDKHFRDCVFKLTEIDNLRQIVEALIEKYPSLYKSKIISKSLKKKNV